MYQPSNIHNFTQYNKPFLLVLVVVQPATNGMSSTHLPVLQYGNAPPKHGADEQASGRTTLAPTTKGILKHTSSVKNDSQHAPSSSGKKQLTRPEKRRMLVFKHMERLLEHGASDMGQLLTLAASFSAAEMDQVAEERRLAGVCGYPLCQQPPAKRKSIRDRFEFDPAVNDLVQRPEDYFDYCSPACRTAMHRLTAKLGDTDDALRRYTLQQTQHECIRLGSLGTVSREDLLGVGDECASQCESGGQSGSGQGGGQSGSGEGVHAGNGQPARNVRFADEAAGVSDYGNGGKSGGAIQTEATAAAAIAAGATVSNGSGSGGTATPARHGSGVVVSHGMAPAAVKAAAAGKGPARAQGAPHILGQVVERVPVVNNTRTMNNARTNTMNTTRTDTTMKQLLSAGDNKSHDDTQSHDENRLHNENKSHDEDNNTSNKAADSEQHENSHGQHGQQHETIIHSHADEVVMMLAAATIEEQQEGMNEQGRMDEPGRMDGEMEDEVDEVGSSEYGSGEDEEDEDEVTLASQLLAHWHRQGGGAGIPLNLSTFGQIYTLLGQWRTINTCTWITDVDVPAGPPAKVGDDSHDMRRMVVLKLLREQVPQLLRNFQVEQLQEQVDNHLAWLLDTMQFAKHAPVLKAHEWQLLTLVLVKALSLQRVPGLQERMDGRAGVAAMQHVACRLDSSVEEVAELLSVVCEED